MTPLLKALKNKDFEMAKLFIAHGAIVDMEDEVHRCPVLN